MRNPFRRNPTAPEGFRGNNVKPNDWQIPSGYTWMRTPDGILATVPDNEVQEKLLAGWKKT